MDKSEFKDLFGMSMRAFCRSVGLRESYLKECLRRDFRMTNINVIVDGLRKTAESNYKTELQIAHYKREQAMKYIDELEKKYGGYENE